MAKLEWLRQYGIITQALLDNPVYRMSLSSKELFHSNFLAWILDTHMGLAETMLTPAHKVLPFAGSV